MSWTWNGYPNKPGRELLEATARHRRTRRNSGLFLSLCLFLAFCGPASPAEEADPPAPVPQPQPSAQIERGRPVWLLDALGNLLSLPKKLILLNRKVDSHSVSPKTEQALQAFLAAHPEAAKDVKVRINQWTPVGEFRRLAQNKRIEWYFRIFPGILTTLFSSVTGRILGGDHYNPYTNTIHLFSDDTAIALHEAGHAVDFARNPFPGLYAVGRILVPVELSQEQTASDIAIQHLKENKDREGELHAYQTLYPAFGTYAGDAAGLPYGNYIGAGVGHVMGFWQRHERRLGYQALDEARVGGTVRNDELSRTLLARREESRVTLLETLGGKHDQARLE
ncbi:MAG: hypothetical protein HYZ73_07895 [Elusimicrobia bacterium]|nr:hypothetical protein [Elusimicrobiota bacterium]